MVSGEMGEIFPPGEKPAAYLELILKGLPEGQEAAFRWELTQESQKMGL